jgi:hypothetical protein
MTLSIMILSIMTLSIMTFSMMVLSIMVQHNGTSTLGTIPLCKNDSKHYHIQHNDTLS